MTFLYLSILIFSLLTLYFIWEDYRQNRCTKRAFIIVTVSQTVAAIYAAVKFVMSVL